MNEQRALDVKAGFPMNAMNGQLFIRGFSGSFRVTGIRYYDLPALA